MRKSFLKGALILSIAPIVTQLFSFIILPFITRMYTPEDFGVYSSIVSVAGVLSVFQGLGYHQAIILPQSDSISKLIYNICLLITIFLSVIYLLLFLLIPDFFIVRYIPQTILDFKYSILMLLLLHGLYSCLSIMNIRKGNYKIIAISRVLRVVANKFTIISLGLFVFVSPSNLIYADIFASVTVSLVLLFGTKNIFFKQKVDLKLIKKILYKYRQFPIYNLPSDVVFRLKQAAVVILFLKFFGAEVVGYYAMALLILSIPSTIIGSAIGEVFYKESAEYKSNDELKKSLLEMLTLMVSVSLIIFLSLALFSDRIIPLLLGGNWSGASSIISILVIICFSDFVIGPFLNIFKVLNIQKFSLIYQTLVLLFSILSIWIGSKLDSYIYSFLFYSMTNFLITISVLILIFRISKIKLQSLNCLNRIFFNTIPSILIFLIYKNYYTDIPVYYDFIVIFISIFLNYYLNYKYISAFKVVSNYLIIDPINKLCKKK